MEFNRLLNIFLLNELLTAEQRHNFRIERRILRDCGDPFSLPNAYFKQMFRLNKENTRSLINFLEPFIRPTQRNTAVPLELKVLIALHFFGFGSYQRCIGGNFNFPVDQSVTSRIINVVTNAICDHLVPDWIKFPTSLEEQTRVKSGFNERFGMPGVVGAIDCTHIAIIAPMDDPIRPGYAYINRKGYHSLNVQMICDSDLRILNCNARHPGSAHDAGIWAISSVRRKLNTDYVAGNLTNTWLLGDSGYGLEPFLMTPIDNAPDGSPEDQYNQRHILARNTIERCFGLMKQKFRCLLRHRVLHYKPTKASKIVISCAVLHNMSLGDQDMYNLIEEVDQPDLMPVENMEGNLLVEGRRIRARLVRSLLNE